MSALEIAGYLCLGIMILGIIVAGIWAIIYKRTPLGYEDETGFHLGDPPEGK